MTIKVMTKRQKELHDGFIKSLEKWHRNWIKTADFSPLTDMEILMVCYGSAAKFFLSMGYHTNEMTKPIAELSKVLKEWTE